jgi:hypothetical protein
VRLPLTRGFSKRLAENPLFIPETLTKQRR